MLLNRGDRYVGLGKAALFFTFSPAREGTKEVTLTDVKQKGMREEKELKG